VSSCDIDGSILHTIKNVLNLSLINKNDAHYTN
jgi:hypothetical protein